MADFNRFAMLAFAPGTNYVFNAADYPDSLLENFGKRLIFLLNENIVVKGV